MGRKGRGRNEKEGRRETAGRGWDEKEKEKGREIRERERGSGDGFQAFSTRQLALFDDVSAPTVDNWSRLLRRACSKSNSRPRMQRN